jgi:hypothetical protein
MAGMTIISNAAIIDYYTMLISNQLISSMAKYFIFHNLDIHDNEKFNTKR